MDAEVSGLKRKLGENLLSVLKKGKKTIVLVNDTLISSTEENKFKTNISKPSDGDKKVIFLGEIWDDMIAGNSEKLDEVLSSKPVYDIGTIEIMKLAKKLTSIVVDRFIGHIVCTVLYGSAVMGKNTNDVDMAFVIDDTGVDKKDINRADLRENSATIINFIARGLTDERKVHIQVYLLSAFWESIRDAHPIIFTLIRDGVPFYDKGLFKPWKNLLKMGKIKPSVEAIDNFLLSANIFIEKLKDQIRDMTIEDIWYVMINPAQAALMMYGLAPANHRESIQLIRKVFVKKENLLEKKYYNWLKEIFELRKETEQNPEKKIDAEILAKYMGRADEYLDRMNKLFDEIREKKFKHDIISIEKNLKKNVEKAVDVMGVRGRGGLMDTFKNEIMKEGIISRDYVNSIDYLYKIKDNYRSGKVTSEEIRKARNEIDGLISEIRKLVKEKQKDRSEALKIRFKAGETYGNMWVIGKKVFIIKNVKRLGDVYYAKMDKEGKLGSIRKCTMEELQDAMKKTKIIEEAFIKEKTFEGLKKVIQKDVELLFGD